MASSRASLRMFVRLGAVLTVLVGTLSVGSGGQATTTGPLGPVPTIRGPFISKPILSKDITINLRKAPRLAPSRPGQPAIEVERAEDPSSPSEAARPSTGALAGSALTRVSNSVQPLTVTPTEFSNAAPVQIGRAHV